MGTDDRCAIVVYIPAAVNGCIKVLHHPGIDITGTTDLCIGGIGIQLAQVDVTASVNAQVFKVHGSAIYLDIP